MADTSDSSVDGVSVADQQKMPSTTSSSWGCIVPCYLQTCLLAFVVVFGMAGYAEFRPAASLPDAYTMPASLGGWERLNGNWRQSSQCHGNQLSVETIKPALCGPSDPGCDKLRQQLASSTVHGPHAWDEEVPTSWDYGLQRSFMSRLLRTWESYGLAISPTQTGNSSKTSPNEGTSPMLETALHEFDNRQVCVMGSTVHMFALDSVAIHSADLEQLLLALTPSNPSTQTHLAQIRTDRAQVLDQIRTPSSSSHGERGSADLVRQLRAKHVSLVRELRHTASSSPAWRNSTLSGISPALVPATPAMHALAGSVSTLMFNQAAHQPRYHQEKSASTVRPLLMLLHGWPSGPAEYLPVLRLLRNLTQRAHQRTTSTNTDDQGAVIHLDVIVPGLPGFGRSQPMRSATNNGAGVFDKDELWQLQRRGPDPVDLAHWAGAVARTLGYVGWDDASSGYPGYYVSGGDYGGLIGSVVAQIESSSNLRGAHLSMWPVQARKPSTIIKTILSTIVSQDVEGLAEFLTLGKADTDRFGGGSVLNVLARLGLQSGYMHQQATFPDTLAIALESSPTAAAAWIVDKFIVWQQRCFDARLGDASPAFNDPGDCLFKLYPLSDLLLILHDHVASPRAPVRLYRDALRSPRFLQTALAGVSSPVALLDLAEETLFRMPDAWAGDKYSTIQQRGSLSRSGHFAGLVEPEALTSDILRFLFAREARLSRQRVEQANQAKSDEL